MKIEVSIGEVLDKISILAIKLDRIQDEDKLKNIQKEFTALTSQISSSMYLDKLYMKLCQVNQKLWNVEDKLRDHERLNNFNEDFINLARSVYKLNDERARIKKEINVKYGSELVEEKSYQEY
jgi:hypothetical protein